MKNVFLVGTAATGLLKSATDAKNRPLSVTALSNPTVNGGVAVLTDKDGSFDYQPPPGFTGVDILIYTVSNGVGRVSAHAVVNVVYQAGA
jgi:hypothetical protein